MEHVSALRSPLSTLMQSLLTEKNTFQNILLLKRLAGYTPTEVYTFLETRPTLASPTDARELLKKVESVLLKFDRQSREHDWDLHEALLNLKKIREITSLLRGTRPMGVSLFCALTGRPEHNPQELFACTKLIDLLGSHASDHAEDEMTLATSINVLERVVHTTSFVTNEDLVISDVAGSMIRHLVRVLNCLQSALQKTKNFSAEKNDAIKGQAVLVDALSPFFMSDKIRTALNLFSDGPIVSLNKDTIRLNVREAYFAGNGILKNKIVAAITDDCKNHFGFEFLYRKKSKSISFLIQLASEELKSDTANSTEALARFVMVAKVVESRAHRNQIFTALNTSKLSLPLVRLLKEVVTNAQTSRHVKQKESSSKPSLRITVNSNAHSTTELFPHAGAKPTSAPLVKLAG